MALITLLAYGCPPQEIVAAFGFRERMVMKWREQDGKHAEHFAWTDGLATA